MIHIATRFAKGLGGLEQYRIPAIPTFGHDAERFEFARPWLEGLNSGDPRGTKYFETVLKTTRDVAVINALPPDAQEQMKKAYAVIEMMDSVAMMGGHQSALVRGYSGKLQEIVGLLENLVISNVPELHELTAVLDKIAVGGVVANRHDMAGNQLLSNSLEQLLAANVRKRNTEVLNLNGRLTFMRNNGEMSRSNVDTATADLTPGGNHEGETLHSGARHRGRPGWPGHLPGANHL